MHQSEGRSSVLTFGITAPSIEVVWPQPSATYAFKTRKYNVIVLAHQAELFIQCWHHAHSIKQLLYGGTECAAIWAMTQCLQLGCCGFAGQTVLHIASLQRVSFGVSTTYPALLLLRRAWLCGVSSALGLRVCACQLHPAAADWRFSCHLTADSMQLSIRAAYPGVQCDSYCCDRHRL